MSVTRTSVATGVALVLVAIWLGASIAALLTGIRDSPPMFAGVAVAVLILGLAIALGHRTRRSPDTVYW